MSQFKMRIHVEMIPCDDAPATESVEAEDGSLFIILSETDAVNIDVCEQALLQTTYATLRATLATHFGEMAKQHAQRRQPEGTLTANTRPYRVDGEVGRFECTTYRVCQEESVVYDSARELFAPLGCWDRYETIGFKELGCMYGMTERSSRKTEKLMNRIRHQHGATGATTLRTSAEREGQKVLACLERTTTEILQEAGFDAAGHPLDTEDFVTQEAVLMSTEQINDAVAACDVTGDELAEVTGNPVLYEQPNETVNISLDDVVVKKQKLHRINGDEAEHTEQGDAGGRHYVHNTVAHIQHGQQSYCITGQGVPAVLRIVVMS